MSMIDRLLDADRSVTEIAEEQVLQRLHRARQGGSKRECARAEIAYKHARDAADRARMAVALRLAGLKR